jgi:hypothetical protein
MFMADTVKFIVENTGWVRIALVACTDIYCQGLAHGVKQHLAMLEVDILFEEPIRASVTSADAPAAVAKIKERFEAYGCPKIGPPIVILIGHVVLPLFVAAQEEGFYPLWLGSEGTASDLKSLADAVFQIEFQKTAIIMVRAAPPMMTRRGKQLATALASTDQFFPFA